MAQIINDPNGGINSGVMGGLKPTNLSKEDILANAQLMTDGGMCLNSEGKKVGCNTLNQTVQSLAVTDPAKNMTKMHIGLFVGGVVVGYFLLKMLKK